MHLRVQRLHPAPQHLRSAREILDLRHFHALAGEQRRRAAGGEQIYAQRSEPAGELDDPGFVGHGKQGARHGHAGLHNTCARPAS